MASIWQQLSCSTLVIYVPPMGLALQALYRPKPLMGLALQALYRPKSLHGSSTLGQVLACNRALMCNLITEHWMQRAMIKGCHSIFFGTTCRNVGFCGTGLSIALFIVPGVLLSDYCLRGCDNAETLSRQPQDTLIHTLHPWPP